MTSATSSQTTAPIVQLKPSYTIPLVLVIAAILVVFFQPWLSLALAFLGFFLMFQTATIRLEFTETSLDLYRSGTLIRRFPYQEWQSWRIFWPPFPVLFYFKEIKSIHFVPILFDAKMLQTCLEQRCPVNTN